MKRLRHVLSGLARDSQGATSIEYALIAALIFLVLLGSASLLGLQVSGTMDDNAEAISAAMSGS